MSSKVGFVLLAIFVIASHAMPFAANNEEQPRDDTVDDFENIESLSEQELKQAIEENPFEFLEFLRWLSDQQYEDSDGSELAKRGGSNNNRQYKKKGSNNGLLVSPVFGK